MQARLAILLFALSPIACDAEPEFIGVLESKAGTYVAVRFNAGERAIWAGIGDEVGGYRILSYQPARESLLLRGGDSSIEVKLKTASVKSAPSLDLLERLSGGEEGLRKQFEIARTLDERSKSTAKELATLEARAAKDRSVDDQVADLRRKLKIEESNRDWYLSSALEIIEREASEARSRKKA